MKTDWKLMFNNSPGFDRYIIFREIREDGGIVKEFSLKSPSHVKLYFALKDWFNGKRS